MKKGCSIEATFFYYYRNHSFLYYSNKSLIPYRLLRAISNRKNINSSIVNAKMDDPP